MAVSTCIHGFAPGQCLICQTLEGGKERPGKEQDRQRGHPTTLTSRPTPVRPDAVLRERPRSGHSLAWRAGGLVLLLALVAFVGVWIIGLAFALLRTIELVAIAILAGWVGYRIGVYRGRHLGKDR
jgi:hypothetical protein